MARKARLKSDDSIFHIMCKSISEVTLFKEDEDKKKYLSLLKKYKQIYDVKIYGYCLMDNHAHLLIDVHGADISKVMHGINFSYAIYFNRKYKRYGHLFKDRFKSKIVGDDRYLKLVSLYIHNNPTDISEFKNCPEKYVFSSLGIYINKTQDESNLVHCDSVMGLFGNTFKSAKKSYLENIVGFSDDKMKEYNEFADEKSEYKSETKIITRNFTSESIIEFVASKMNIPRVLLHTKYSRTLVPARALTVVLMRSLCNLSTNEISKVLGNITQARISKLCSIGIDLIKSENKYENIIGDFIECYH